jgi:hypothetical protein
MTYEMTDESDHDILIEVRADLKHLLLSQQELKKGMYGEDGQGGLCGRVSKLESFQATLIGIAGVVSLTVSLVWSKIGALFSGGN